MFCKRLLSLGVARRARLFVGLRYAPASSKPGPAGERFLPSWGSEPQSPFVPPAVSFCSRPDTGNWNWSRSVVQNVIYAIPSLYCWPIFGEDTVMVVCWRWLCSLILFCALTDEILAGGSGLNVVVVVNTNSTNSLQLGNYYCEK